MSIEEKGEGAVPLLVLNNDTTSTSLTTVSPSHTLEHVAVSDEVTVTADEKKHEIKQQATNTNTNTIEEEMIYQQIQSLVTNDQKMLSKLFNPQLLLQSHPLHQTHNKSIALVATEGSFLPSNPSDELVSSKAVTSRTNELKIPSISAIIAKEINDDNNSNDSSILDGDEENTPLLISIADTNKYDYGYPTPTVAPLQGTGTLSAANNVPIPIDIPIKENNNHNNSTCSRLTRPLQQYCQCLLSFVSYFIFGSVEAMYGVASSPQKRLLILPFMLTIFSIVYFAFYYVNS